jgi:hypothetical protein
MHCFCFKIFQNAIRTYTYKNFTSNFLNFVMMQNTSAMQSEKLKYEKGFFFILN